MPLNSITFYVYVLAYPPRGKEAIGKVFYVGKGKGRRVFRHEAEARRGHVCAKCDTIRSIWQTGGEVQRVTVFTTDDEAAAYAYETELIALYGLTALANRNAGGLGACHDDATRAKLSAAAKARWQDPVYRERCTAINKARANDPAMRERHSVAIKAKWEDPVYRAQATAAITAGCNTPEWRAYAGARSDAMWQDPEIRAQLTTHLRAQQPAASKIAVAIRKKKKKDQS